MARAAVLLADGFEEIEAVTIVDVLRRGGVEVLVAALSGDSALGSHAIRVAADTSIDDLDPAALDAVVLPGGLPGSYHLRDDERVLALVRAMAAADKWVAAICAAPVALEKAGVLAGRQATSYPGQELPSADYRMERVVEDGRVVTSRAAGTAMEFALHLVRRLVGHEKATELRRAMLVAG